MVKHPAVAVTAIVMLALLEGFALYKGVDGLILATVVGAIAGIAGFTLPSILKK